MAENKIEIVRYNPEFKQDVIDLQSYLWSTDRSLNKAYFEWKYQHNPYRDEPLIHLAICHGKVVGMRGLSGLLWRIGEQSNPFPALYADDLVIAPEYRGKRIPEKIMRAACIDAAEAGYKYLFNISAGSKTLHISKHMGWRNAGFVEPYARKQKNKSSYNLETIPFLGRLERQFSKLSSRAERRSEPFRYIDQTLAQKSNVTVSKDPRPEPMMLLLNSVAGDNLIRHSYDRDYLLWRFCNPMHEYRFLYLGEERLDGYLVLQRNRTQTNHVGVNIVDFRAIDENALRILVETAMGLGRFPSISTWLAGCNESVRHIFRSREFETVLSDRKDYLPCLLITSTRPKVQSEEWLLGDHNLLNLNNWDLRMIYSMHG